MRDRNEASNPQRGSSASQEQAPKKRMRVKNLKADSLRTIRKRKTFAGYGLVFVLLFSSVLLSLGGLKSLGNAFILAGVFWGIIWWRVSPKMYRRFVGDVAVCAECGAAVDLVDAWKCPACGKVASKHILEPCERCGTRGGKLGCSSCGASISV